MEYKDYVTCFANRAKEVLEKFSECDKENELNVTALLSVATSAFVIPFERLKEEHPSGDRKDFKYIADKIDVVLSKNISNSELTKGLLSWKIKKISKSTINENYDLSSGFEAIDGTYKIKSLVDIIRNALVHGNIYSYSNDKEGGHINTLNFFSKNNMDKKCFLKVFDDKTLDYSSKPKCKRIYECFKKCRDETDGFNALECSLTDFKKFVIRWIELLNATKE